MKLRDWLSLVVIVGALALMFFVTRFVQPERVQPGSPEYEAYIDRFVAECLRNPQPIKASTNGREPSDAEREATCRATVLQADRFNPDGRPLKH
jgi:hypothetical protein